MHGLQSDNVRFSIIINERPKVISSAILRSNFDVCFERTLMVLVRLKAIFCPCETRTRLTRAAMKRYMPLLFNSLARWFRRSWLADKPLKHILLLVTKKFRSDVVNERCFSHYQIGCLSWFEIYTLVKRSHSCEIVSFLYKKSATFAQLYGIWNEVLQTSLNTWLCYIRPLSVDWSQELQPHTWQFPMLSEIEDWGSQRERNAPNRFVRFFRVLRSIAKSHWRLSAADKYERRSPFELHWIHEHLTRASKVLNEYWGVFALTFEGLPRTATVSYEKCFNDK